ncbi:hypothetical protein FQA39_LY12993 [Lamprigera yunnana]|nr:hypothetical protein FQA39_LY12993 [Lamprigera yunnana]
MDNVIVPLKDRISGRFSFEDIVDAKELLDVTRPKGAVAIISELNRTITDVIDLKKKFIHIIVEDKNKTTKKYKPNFNAVLRVKKGDEIKAGQKLTEGAIDLHMSLLEIRRTNDVQTIFLKEVQKVYRLQGIEISDKYYLKLFYTNVKQS